MIALYLPITLCNLETNILSKDDCITNFIVHVSCKENNSCIQSNLYNNKHIVTGTMCTLSHWEGVSLTVDTVQYLTF